MLSMHYRKVTKKNKSLRLNFPTDYALTLLTSLEYLLGAFRGLQTKATPFSEAIYLKSLCVCPCGIQALRRDLARRAEVVEAPASHGHCRRDVNIEKGGVGRVADDASRRNLSLGTKIKGQVAIAQIRL